MMVRQEINGPVTINTGIGSGATSVAANPAGGNLHYEVEVPVTGPAGGTLVGLFRSPGNHYINLHTVVNPGGAIRAQLRNTDKAQYRVLMTTANEVPAITDVEGNAPAVFTAHTIRNANGTVAGGVAIFDVNYRFAGEQTFTGLHIHDEKAGVNGPVTINTGIGGANTVPTATGFGNVYRTVTVSNTAGIASLNSLVANPEAHYINIHTSVKTGGVVRSQLAPANANLPTVSAVISAVSDPTLRTVAPGGLMTIFGTDLVKADTDIGSSFSGNKLPTAFNGTSVTVGGKAAALLIVQKDYIVAQVPTDAAQGDQSLVVRNANGEMRTASTTRVSNFAPGLYFGPSGGVFSKADYSVVEHQTRCVRAICLGVGNGFRRAYRSRLGSDPDDWRFAGLDALYDTAPVTVTVGGQNATVMQSVAAPGYAGLVQVLFAVPQGVSGNVPVVVTLGGIRSNSVLLPVR